MDRRLSSGVGHIEVSIRSGFFRHILSVGLGSLSAQLLTAATLPLLTRLYMPAAYSGWALLMSVVLIVASVSTLRYELAIVLPDTHEEAANVMIGCMGIACAVAMVSGLLLPWCGSWMLGESFSDELHGWLWCMPPLIVCMGFYQALNAWCTRTREFTWYSLSQVTLPFATVICQILAAFWGPRTAAGLILGTLLGQFLATFLVLSLVSMRYGRLIRNALSKAKIWDSLIRYKAYPLYMTPYTVAGTVRERLVYFLFASSGERLSLGFYNLSSRMVNLPNSLVSSAVRPVFFQHAASMDFRLLERPVNKALRLLAVCVVPFWVVFLFHADSLFALFFGEPWRQAGLYAAILSVPAIPLLLSNWLDRAFDALGRQRLAFALEFVFSILSVAALAFGVLYFQNVLVAVCLQAGVLTIYYCYWLAALFHAADFSRGNLLRLLMTIAVLGTASSLIAGAIRSITPDPVSFVISTVVFSTLVFAYLFRQWRIRDRMNRSAMA
jgi:O-antigen/teichoic acid export membrane protein